ncbi:MAG: ATP-grasp domain-containing protein [Candidatus Sericytochromatia bacterium]
MARLLCLGAAASQVPIIRRARDAGHEVLTTDYLPDNPGHRLAHRAYGVSTTDRAGVLALARAQQIDGIVAFASEPAAPTAAYVSEKLGLPGNPFASVLNLSHKGRFRRLLQQAGLPSPRFATAQRLEAACALLAKRVEEGPSSWLIKPVDASGSKGVSRWEVPAEAALASACLTHGKQSLQAAFAASLSGEIILEEALYTLGPQIHGEALVHNGQVVLCSLGDEYFSPFQPLVPFATILPSLAHSGEVLTACAELVQQIVTASGYRNGGMNVEIRRGPDTLYAVELSPRSGGSFMTRLAQLATGWDLVQANLEMALGTYTPQSGASRPGWHVLLDMHSEHAGVLAETALPPALKECLVESQMLYAPGDTVPAFSDSRDVIGSLLLKLQTPAQLISWRAFVGGKQFVTLKA